MLSQLGLYVPGLSRQSTKRLRCCVGKIHYSLFTCCQTTTCRQKMREYQPHYLVTPQPKASASGSTPNSGVTNERLCKKPPTCAHDEVRDQHCAGARVRAATRKQRRSASRLHPRDWITFPDLSVNGGASGPRVQQWRAPLAGFDEATFRPGRVTNARRSCC